MSNFKTELIFHPIRMRILQALLRDGPAATGELREVLSDVPPATLYRHVKRLAAGGVLELVEERPIRGVVERVYAVSTRGGASLSAQEMEQAGREQQLRYFGLFLASLMGEFERYLSTPNADPASDGVGYRQFPMYLSDQELDVMLRSMNALIQSAMNNEPRPGRRRRVLTRILLPGVETSAPRNEKAADDR